MPDVMPTVSFEAIRDAMRDGGSGDTEVFGYGEKADGLYLQQDLYEFSALILYLCENVPPPQLSLDIGVASGGQTKLLRDFFPCQKTIVVDIGQHHQFCHWPRIKKLVKTDFVLELIEDSHSEGVREALKPYVGQIDFAFIDGDHSYEGLKQDIKLVWSLAKSGCVFVLHDTYAVPDCRRVFEELRQKSKFSLLFNIERKFGISVWRMNRLPAEKSAKRRLF